MKLVRQNSCVLIEAGSKTQMLSTQEIFELFSGKNLQIGENFATTEDLMALGLEKSKYVAKPMLLLESTNGGSETEITANIVYQHRLWDRPVMANLCPGQHHFIHNGCCVPVLMDTVTTIDEFLQHVDLDKFGSITIAQYLKILSSGERFFPVLDKTGQEFSATNLSVKFKGKQPKELKAKLYPYQMSGFLWLKYMYENKLGSIVGDEMGLGKTIQVISLLLVSKSSQDKPSLVISPATILENWRRELKKFAPSIGSLVHRGYNRTGFQSDLEDQDVVITSFETAVSDISLLRNITWDIMVVDEAQGIKNPESKRREKLVTIPRNCAIAVTGTPVENRLTDLWSIVDFVLPSMLGSRQDFELNYPDSFEAATYLEPLVTPILLRRRVVDVASDLPDRVVIPHPIEMLDESANAYEMIRLAESERSKFGFAGLVKLRMFCVHPWLVEQFMSVSDPKLCSAKLARLSEILEEIISLKDKALIFSSYTDGMDLLVNHIKYEFNIPVGCIDGRLSIDDRQPLIDEFSSLRGAAVLVMNPKAAGTGLNITAANHVIHYNLEWNPATEDQASARAHRRGQEKSVMIHRLYYLNTVEEVINERLESKRVLASAAVVGSVGKESEVQDLIKAFKISPLNKL